MDVHVSISRVFYDIDIRNPFQKDIYPYFYMYPAGFVFSYPYPHPILIWIYPWISGMFLPLSSVQYFNVCATSAAHIFFSLECNAINNCFFVVLKKWKE